MTRIRFHELTPEQRAFVCNGCGRKGGLLDPPDWMFTASCDHHDFNYWLGYRELDRAKADWQFYQAMLEDASRSPWWSRAWHKLMAWAYYKAVSYFGKAAFHYGERERTLEDLQAEMMADGGANLSG